MHFSVNALLTVSVASLAAEGAALKRSSPSSSFQVHQIANPSFRGSHGPGALAQLSRKYNVPVAAVLASAGFSAPATSVDQGNRYAVPVQIGSPPQMLRLTFDSGSSDLWAMDTQLQTAGGSNPHSSYDTSKSTTAQQVDGETFSDLYADQSFVRGDVFVDVVTVGGLSFGSQSIGVANNLSANFLSQSVDGILGLASAPSDQGPLVRKSFFQNVAPTLDQPVLVADLNHEAPGSFTFGQIPSQVTDIHYAPITADANGSWEFIAQTADGIANFAALSDTGTTLIILLEPQVLGYYAAVPSARLDTQAGGWVFSCSETLPDWTFLIDGAPITIPGFLLNHSAIDSSGQTCFGGIQALPSFPKVILGDVVFQAAYGIFDLGNNRVGFAQKGNAAAAPSSPPPSSPSSPSPSSPSSPSPSSSSSPPPQSEC